MSTIDDTGRALLARHQHRKIELEGSCNCRDFGGLRVPGGGRTRPGRVFRSDALATLTDADRATLATLGVRSVFDLRTEEERQRAPNRLPGPLPVQHALGFLPRGNPEMFAAVNAGELTAAAARAQMCAQYERLALDHTDQLATMYRLMLETGGAPALLHCASGKDRTGIGSAFLLLMIGVGRDDVFEDYLISHYQRRHIDLFTLDAPNAAVFEIMSAHEEYLAAGLAAIDREFGTFGAFAERRLGMTPGMREALIALLVE